MSVLSKEDLLSAIKTRLGEDTSDEAIKFLEDVSDTVSDLESKANGDGEDWKTKYADLDKEWRKRYTDRFFNGSSEGNEDDNFDEHNGDEDNAPKTYEDLFKTE